MDTRASHSSPYFLRVADASAASSASKITSLSTPFSLETASTTIRISLFTCLSTSHARCALPISGAPRGAARSSSRREPRLTDLCKGNRYLLLVDLEGDARIVDRKQRAGVTAAPLARHLQLDEYPRPHEAPEMRLCAQHPVEARRRHLERIGRGNRVGHIEHGRYLPAHPLAVLQAHALRSIDEQAHRGVRAPRGVLELDELVAQPPEQGLYEADEPLSQDRRRHHFPAVTTRPFQPTTQSPRQNRHACRQSHAFARSPLWTDK